MPRKVLIQLNNKAVTPKEAAKILGVSTSSICNYLKNGKLKEIENEYYNFIEKLEFICNKKLNSNSKKILQKMIKYLDKNEIIDNFIEYDLKTEKEKEKRSLDNFLLIYGEKQGKIKYNNYLLLCKQNISNKSSSFYKRKSIWSKEYWVSRGYSEEQAIEQIKQHQKKNGKKANLNRKPESRTTNLNYWLSKGYDEDTAKEKLRERQTTRKNLNEIKNSLTAYYKEVWYNTNKNKHLVLNIEKRSTKYHIDHVFSIRDGFDNNVPPEIIGSHINLRILGARENIKKYRKSELSLEELYEKYESLGRKNSTDF